MGFAISRRWFAAAFASLSVFGAQTAAAQPSSGIVLASTTSTEQSGLFTYLLPLFTASSGIEVRVVAVGSGQALDIGRRGDADVLLTHDPAGEERFIADGGGIARWPVMYNDFVLVGPRNDPARTKGADIAHAMRQLAASQHSFVSRGDRSGTHAAELRYLQLAAIAEPQKQLRQYKACGCGMGQALNIASSTNAYVLSDRGSWLSFKNPGNLALLVQGDERLFNQYSVIAVNPQRHPHVNGDGAQTFIKWLRSPQGQRAIASFRVANQQLFFPNAM